MESDKRGGSAQFGRSGVRGRARRRASACVRDRTETYEIVRERTASYDIVRDRTSTYENVRKRTKRFSRQARACHVLRAFAGRFGAFRREFRRGFCHFGKLGNQLSAFSLRHLVGAMASLAWPCTPSQDHHAPDSQIRSSKSERQHSAFSLQPKKQRQSACCLLLSLADR